jgi:hypothetical protein
MFLVVGISYAWICHVMNFEHIENLAPLVAIWVTMDHSKKVLEWIEKCGR